MKHRKEKFIAAVTKLAFLIIGISLLIVMAKRLTEL